MRATIAQDVLDAYLIPASALAVIGLPAVASTIGFAMVMQGNLLGLACLLCPAILAWGWWVNRYSWENETSSMLELWFRMWLYGAPIGGVLGMIALLVKSWVS
jgi:hypothetical protein